MTEAAKGHFAMAAFAAVVSGSFAFGGMAAPYLDPAALNAVRFLIAALVIGGLALAGPGLKASALTTAPWRYFVLGGLMSVYMVTMFEALQVTSPVSTGAVFTLAPILSALFGWMLLRQVTTRFNAFALAIGGVGAIWVIFRGDVDAMLGFEVGWGERLFFVGVAAHAFYAPMVRLLNRGEPVMTFTFGTIAASTLVLAIWAGSELWRADWAALPAVVWVTILYTAIGATAGSFFLVQFAALRLPAGKVMAYTYLTPCFVILWEAALGHGWAPATVWLGAGVAVLGLALLAWR